MNDHENKDPDKEEDKELMEVTEEELRKMINDFREKQTRFQVVKSSIFFNPNLGIHMLVSFILNCVSGITVLGITGYFYKMVEWTAASYFIGITVFTLISNALTITVGYLVIKKVLLFYPFIDFGLKVLSFYLVSLITLKTFNFPRFFDLLIFTLLFTVMVYLLSTIYRKIYTTILKRKRANK